MQTRGARTLARMTGRVPAHHRRLLGVALGVPTMAAALAQLPRLRADGADVVELRLDLFEEPLDLPALVHARGDVPVVVTLRPLDQGGRSALAAAQRLSILVEAAHLGAEYVDVEWDAASSQAVAMLRAAGAAVIVSRHDFTSMPDLRAWYADLAASGADVVKVVGMATSARDCLAALDVLREADRPTVAIAMGEAGLASRILALRSPQCLLTFAAPNDAAGTAPGQVSLRQMRELYRAGSIGPHTAVYGVLDTRLQQDLAEAFNQWLAQAQVQAVAVPFVADDALACIEAARTLPVAGWHIGPEFRETVGQAVDHLDATACRAGAVSTTRLRDGVLEGAWFSTPEEELAYWTGRHPAHPG